MTPAAAIPVASHGRRVKTAFFLLACGCAGAAPHTLEPPRHLLPAAAVTLLLGTHVVRTLLAASRGRRAPSAEGEAPSPPAFDGPWPSVDVVVAARDEQAVIGRLVERLAALRYPREALRLWVVDDGSEDGTPEVLAALCDRLPQLRVLRRPRQAGGGKSGALNAVLGQLQGRWMLVLDADAGLAEDVLERLVAHAESGAWAAVQLRKAVVNAGANLLTRGQAMEMALDAVVQEGRQAMHGVVELRGNGQLLRRDVVHAVGGFNEATVTDDLDLSFRFLVAGERVGVLWDPAVEEEAVLTLPALWRQRQRWAEGGLQRFFDYAPALLSSRLSGSQRFDLASYFLLQYALPVVSVADLAAALLSRTAPTVWPLSLLALGLSGVAILQGCRRAGEGPPLPDAHPLDLCLGIAYLGHWFAVIPWVVLRMALLPKRLVWAKTSHHGTEVATPPDAAGLAVLAALDPLADSSLEGPPDADLSTQIT